MMRIFYFIYFAVKKLLLRPDAIPLCRVFIRHALNHLAEPKTLLHARIYVEVDDDAVDADNIPRGVFQCGTLLVKNCANRLVPKIRLSL